MSIDYLVTHSGGFHADELLSSAILTRLFPDAELRRTRDRQWLTPAPDKIIYDVGGAYDSEAQIFDHHQRPSPLREDGQPYSSFGLIWAQYGRDYLAALSVPAQDIDAVHTKFDSKFVLPIDLLDNGAIEPSVAGPLSGLTLPALLGSLKPVFDDTSPTADDDAFVAALPIVSTFIEAQIRNMTAKARAQSIVLDAIAAAGSSAILELPMGMPYAAALDQAGADHILFVVCPRGEEWTIGGIKLSKDTFEQRADLPAAWAGLTNEALEDASGVKGAKFCHNARFIAVADSRDAIMQMAAIAVEMA
ncbi:MYG1 family protein [Sulfitobacter geojensis]|uniref:MYG1 family protein n=1 Tax=Sulfitobacter geojensis TaxID=1342299 RepID=A0AAE2VVV1_9RHOB|nr:MYG1 family protein [Sulfitobacter geojensis]MBM1688092.1 MYG1 family protein [Sulfitobacter geojensis]MBM1692159.1 MYG1 family protein [Sulfitobacter geojensis]MBM1704325.1 MYG1 family protein [Sulfitobacter geojensis]MBM1708383.1 MYG1 family protein [Sulfitobacter geojensis]MBM1712448.1 MYG1 family protein [Sulfitobacter geojensis]